MQRPVGREPDPVAGGAEVLGDGRDDPEPAVVFGAGGRIVEAIVPGRSSARCGRSGCRHHPRAGVGGAEGVADLAGAHEGPRDVERPVRHRHLLDEAGHEAALPRVVAERGDLVVVEPPDRHRVDLDRGEARRAGGLDPVQHAWQRSAARDAPEALRVERVDADVQAIDARRAQRRRQLAETVAVGGQRQILDAGQSAQGGGQRRQIVPHRGLPAGQTQPPHPEPHEARHEAGELPG